VGPSCKRVNIIFRKKKNVGRDVIFKSLLLQFPQEFPYANPMNSEPAQFKQ
jgi:hypothetical protein